MIVQVSTTRNGDRGVRLVCALDREAADALQLTHGNRVFFIRRGDHILIVKTTNAGGRPVTYSQASRKSGRLRVRWEEKTLAAGLRTDATAELIDTPWGKTLKFSPPDWMPVDVVAPRDQKPNHNGIFSRKAVVPIPPVSDRERARLIAAFEEDVGVTKGDTKYVAAVQQ